MEEKYKYQDKKRVLKKLIHNKLKKTIFFRDYLILDIKTENKTCIYCQNENNDSLNKLYCSDICESISKSLIIYNSYISHLPFSFLTNSSKKKYIEFINKTKNINYDKLIIYNYFINEKVINGFKKNNTKYIFIKNFDIIFSFEIMYDTILFKFQNLYLNSINSQKIDNRNTMKEVINLIENEIGNTCLYCNKHEKGFFINLPNNYYLGYVCDNICFKIVFSNNANFIKQPEKYLLNFPPIEIIKNPEKIINKKKEFTNYYTSQYYRKKCIIKEIIFNN